ncbi:hypothetical protein NA63_0123 [Flavobacteriaceae bacterium MAR_2010_105]|nr:hypothetical protein NA63_0123 [Flavobacteriaceae bacterium MAR_2010_105]
MLVKSEVFYIVSYYIFKMGSYLHSAEMKRHVILTFWTKKNTIVTPILWSSKSV